MDSGVLQFSLQLQQALVWLTLLGLVGLAAWRCSARGLVALTAFMTIELIMFGAFVRLSDSGLGCPDWPGCYGKFVPLSASADIAKAVALQGGEHGWVSMTKAWIEMLHRYWASGIGMLIIVIAWRAYRAREAMGMPLFILAVVIVQGLFGKLTVTMKLMPAIVTLHLLGGMLLWSLLLWHFLATRVQHPVNAQIHMHVLQSERRGIVRLYFAALVALVLQIALGGWTSTNYAAMACADWPLCQGQLWPAMDMSNGFDVSRDMGRLASGEIIPLAALAAIHFVHRNFAYVLAALIVLLAWRIHLTGRFGRLALWLCAALALQMVIGIATVVFNQPLLLAVAHNGGAAVLMGVMVLAGYKIRHSKPR